MNNHQLRFAVFVINKYALATQQSVGEVYGQFNALHIIDDYILKHYDILHTFGEKYLMDDLSEFVSQKISQK